MHFLFFYNACPRYLKSRRDLPYVKHPNHSPGVPKEVQWRFFFFLRIISILLPPGLCLNSYWASSSKQSKSRHSNTLTPSFIITSMRNEEESEIYKWVNEWVINKWMNEWWMNNEWMNDEWMDEDSPFQPPHTLIYYHVNAKRWRIWNKHVNEWWMNESINRWSLYSNMLTISFFVDAKWRGI